MRTNNLLTSIALGAGLLSSGAVLDLLYKAMYTGNRNGITCMDCNSVGEGTLEVIILCVFTLIIFYTFIISLNKLV